MGENCISGITLFAGSDEGVDVTLHVVPVVVCSHKMEGFTVTKMTMG